MKRILAIVILGVGILVADWAAAQPPEPGAEPPVRLKKKKKEKPEEKNPDKAEPMPPKKVKPDEEPDLDPRDEAKPGEPAAQDSAAILKRLERNARLSEEKLGKRDVSEPTQKVQDEIVKDIDKLIQQLKDQQNQDQNQQQNNDPKDQQPQPGSKQDPSQQRQARQRERNQRKGQQQGQQASRQQNQGGQGQGTPQNPKGGGDSAGGGKTGTADKKTDLWGHLPEKERALMNKEMEQKFMEKYDELTKQYYRIIAEKSRK